MQIVINEGNKELIYELYYDEKSLRILISEIIKNCSIIKEGKYFIQARSYKEAETTINSTTNYNGDKIYKNVSNIKEESIDDPFDFWRHGDPLTYSFKANALLSPKLVDFLINLINEKEIDYEWFASRKELNEKNKLRLEIEKLDSEINAISNFETERKIRKLEELSRKVHYLDNLPNFNYNLLSRYYDITKTYIQFELIQETVKFPKKLIKNIKQD